MKHFNFLLGISILALLLSSCAKEKSITIKGHVQFADPDFQISVFQWEGSEKSVKATATLDKDNNYSLTLPIEEAGLFVVDCGHWQSVSVWGDDEDLTIDFRGRDTAKIIIKNPPYVYIEGGKKNEVINLSNLFSYHHYQNLIAISQATYSQVSSPSERAAITNELYQANDKTFYAQLEYLARSYSTVPSVLSILNTLSNSKYDDLREEVLNKMEKANPDYQPIASYRKAREEMIANKKRSAIGSPAPAFEYKNYLGDKVLGPASYQGKVLLVDFWASWCGPCRSEIPNLKEVYEKYKGKGVEFLSVSVDSKEDKWREAVEQEHMPWEQVYTDDSGKKVMELYQFSGIPFIILIDQDGKIAAKHLRGEKVSEEIDKLIK